MRNFIIASSLVLLSLGVSVSAHADMIDDRVVKAERSLANAEEAFRCPRLCR